jgi:hypothetical protein
MPDASQIVAGLTAIANDNLGIAWWWHVAFTAAIALVLAGWRPSRRIVCLLLSGLPASVSAFAFQYGNPFNGFAFGILTLVLLFNAIGADVALLPRKTPSATIVGVGLIAFGWLYPHFLESRPVFVYAFAAPTGLIPCPTLAVLTGATVLLTGLPRNWSLLVGAFGVVYGAFGMLRLGVWLDAGLLGGALYLFTLPQARSLRSPRSGYRITRTNAEGAMS